MEASLELHSSLDLHLVSEKLINKFNDEEIDYFFEENYITSQKLRFVFEIKTKNNISADTVANILGDWILENYQSRIVCEMIETDFPEVLSEKIKILNSVNEKNDLISKIYAKKYIVKNLTEYFETENCIYIDGFIRFRLREYRENLYLLVCQAVEENYIEKEYQEFINLLSFYIENRTPMIDLLHIRPEINGDFSFYDFKKTKISVNVEKNEDLNLIENFLTKDDMLISILITLAPKRIIWHKVNDFENQNIFTTIKSIFKNRFSVCCGCELCDD